MLNSLSSESEYKKEILINSRFTKIYSMLNPTMMSCLIMATMFLTSFPFGLMDAILGLAYLFLTIVLYFRLVKEVKKIKKEKETIEEL